MKGLGIRRWEWRPDWRLWLCCLLLLPLLLGLGVWQLGRAQEKQVLLVRWHGSTTLTDWPELAASNALEGLPVRLQGAYLHEPLWLLDNRTRDGRSGYEVLQLFAPLAGPQVLVNRGWLPAPALRSRLPNVTTPAGPVTLEARVAAYPLPPVLLEERAVDAADQAWPRRVQRLPAAALSFWEARPPAFMLRLQDARQPGAYRADWPASLRGPEIHHGYAVQWFALAGALLLLTISASLRRRNEHTPINERYKGDERPRGDQRHG